MDKRVAYKGKNNPNYRHGKTLKEVYCVDCGAKLSKNAFYYGYTRCLSCSNKRTKAGKKHPRYGTKASPEQRKKMSVSLGGTGIPYEHDDYGEEFNYDLKESIRKRDNYTCQVCYIREVELKFHLSIHHIDYDKYNCDKDNLISLCRACHGKTNHKRKKWQKVCSAKVSAKYTVPQRELV